MKRFILLFSIVLFTTSLKAQVGTDLQFSQAFTWCHSTGAATYPPPYYTVPAGKIWKIVGFTSADYSFITIGNSAPTRLEGSGSVHSSYPLIISENKTVSIEAFTSSSPACISIIEYTVIP